jgi:hypothetical protein
LHGAKIRRASSCKLQAASAFIRLVFFVSVFTGVQSFLLFALMQKVEQKDQGKPQRSAGFAGPRTTVTRSLS